MPATESIREYSEKFPWEIRDAIEGIEGETEQAVMALLMNEEPLAFTEIQEKLSDEEKELHQQTLSNALSNLTSGGLIRKKIKDINPGEDHPETSFSSYYSVSEYGDRFVHSLFDSLGSVDGSSGGSV